MLLIQLGGQVSIRIMRAFTKMRQMIIDDVEVRKEIENLRADVDGKFQVVFETLDQLLYKIFLIETFDNRRLRF